MPRKESKKVNCPECNELVGSQGLGLHRLHKHGVRRKKEPDVKEEKPKDIIEDIMTEEPKEQLVIETPKEEKKEEPVKEIPKPEIKEGEKLPSKKGSSFLDWLFGDDKEDSVSKPDSKKESDDDWW